MEWSKAFPERACVIDPPRACVIDPPRTQDIIEAHQKLTRDITLASEKIKSKFCNWTRTHDHLVHKQTLNHLAKLVK